ncbi:MAG TPA: tail fiber domain-containing protein [Rhizomicrobium sp.]|nr:tail fiber domain-containing protein [Rhizomicrobium sp.]
MFKLVLGIAAGLVLFSNAAMALCTSYPYTLTNGTTADATQVMANFNCAALTSGSQIQNVLLTGQTSVGAVGGFATAGGMDIVASSASLVISNRSSTSYAGMRVYNDIGSPVRALEIDYMGSAYSGGEEGFVGTTGAYPLVLATANTARITVTGVGNVGVGTSSPSYTLHVNGSVAGTSAYNNLSDARLKKNVEPLTGGLSIVSELQPVRFDWRTRGERAVGREFNLSTAHQVGFIAQNLRKVLPEAVTVASGKDAIMSVAESKIVPVLVSAIKELKAANDNQSSEIARLEAQVMVLQRKLGVRTAQR